jgi:hypothetical protein
VRSSRAQGRLRGHFLFRPFIASYEEAMRVEREAYELEQWMTHQAECRAAA